MIIRKMGASITLGVLVGIGFAGTAFADHNPASGGQFCGQDHTGTVNQSEAGEWFVCEERGDDTQPRWYSTDAPKPSPEPSPEPSLEPSAEPSQEAEPTDESTDDSADDQDRGGTGGGDDESLPETGVPTAAVAGGAVALIVAGGGLFWAARRRTTRFTS